MGDGGVSDDGIDGSENVGDGADDVICDSGAQGRVPSPASKLKYV